MDYGYQKRIQSSSIDEAREQVAAALAREGFGVLTEIDVQGTLRKKLGADFRPYLILGACNPQLAHWALREEPEIGLLLPCNVVVQEIDGGGEVEVLVASPRRMFSLVENPRLEPVVQDAEDRLQRALSSLH